MNILHEPCNRLVQAVQNEEVSAREITSFFLDRIEKFNPDLNALLWYSRDDALKQAERIDAKRSSGKDLGMCAGIPVVIKDNICIRDIPSTCGSKMLENYIPPYTGFAVRRIREEDGVIIAKANMDEFAMGSSNENSAFGPVLNPRSAGHVPGGSSGGSAAAVAAGLAPVSLGSDTGGSIRQPASHTGVVGMKPTYGRVSRFGLVAFGSSLDQIGPFGKYISDISLLLSVISAPDPCDGTHNQSEAVRPDVDTMDDFSGVRVGIPREYTVEGIHKDVLSVFEQARGVLEDSGAQVVDISLPHTEYGVAVYYIIACAEASSNLARFDGAHYGFRTEAYDDLISMVSRTRKDGFGDEVKRRILLGTHVLSAGYYDAYYNKALKVRKCIQNDFLEAFTQCDMLFCPVAPTPAFRIGELIDNPLEMYLSDIFTISANLAGVPALSVPAGFSGDGLPVGVQFMGPYFTEEALLGYAALYERLRGFNVQTSDPEEREA